MPFRCRNCLYDFDVKTEPPSAVPICHRVSAPLSYSQQIDQRERPVLPEGSCRNGGASGDLCQIVGPPLHQRTPLFHQIAPEIGPLYHAPWPVGEA